PPGRLFKSQKPDIKLKYLGTIQVAHSAKSRESLTHPQQQSGLREDVVTAIAVGVAHVIGEGFKNREPYWGQPGGLGYLQDPLKSSADWTFKRVFLGLEGLKDDYDISPEELANIASTTQHDLAELYTRILNKSTYPNIAQLILNTVVATTSPYTSRYESPPQNRERSQDNQGPPISSSWIHKMVKALRRHSMGIIDLKIAKHRESS